MVLTTVCRVGARMGRTSTDGFHVDASPSTLWLKVYPPACHPCKVLTSFTTFKPVHFLFTGMCVPCVPCSAAVGPGGRRLAARLVAWHQHTQTGLAPWRKRRGLFPWLLLSSARSRAVQYWPLGEQTGCVVLTTVCRVGARKGRTSSTVVMPMLRRRHCGSKCSVLG